MPNIQATQVKVTLPEELYLLVKSRASRYGLNPSSYLRHLAISDSKDDFPTYPMTTKQEVVSDQAEKDYYAGKTKQIDNIDDWLNNL